MTDARSFPASGGGAPRPRDDGEDSLSTDDIFGALSNQRRRYVVEYLRTREGPATLRELATQIAAWENGVPAEALQRKERKRVYTALHQTHLPKMHQLGLVRYDRNRGTVELTSRLADLEPYLDGGVDRAAHVEGGTFGLAVVTAAVVGLTWLGVLPSVTSPFGYALCIAGLFVLATGLQLRAARRRGPTR